MAVAFTPGLDDEEEKKKAELSSQSGMLGGSGAQAVQAAPGASSGRWTNMMSYVDANKNSTMGDTISGKLGTEKDEADAGVKDAGGKLSGYVADKGLGGQSNIPTDLMGDTSKVTKEGVQKVKSFQGQGFADGANPFLDASKAAAGNVQKVEDKSKDVGEASNLQGFFGKDENGAPVQYSGGEKNLDSFILNNGSGGPSAADKIREKFNGIGGAANTAYKGQVTSVDTAKNKSLATQQGLVDSTKKLQNWRQGVAQTAGTKAQDFNNNGAADRFDYGLNFLPGRQDTGANIQAKTGMTPAQIQTFITGGGDLSKLLIEGDTAIADDFTSDEDRSRSLALSDLGVWKPESFAARRELKGNSIDAGAIEEGFIIGQGRNTDSITASQADYDQNGMDSVVVPPEMQARLKQESDTRKATELQALRDRISRMGEQPTRPVSGGYVPNINEPQVVTKQGPKTIINEDGREEFEPIYPDDSPDRPVAVDEGEGIRRPSRFNQSGPIRRN